MNTKDIRELYKLACARIHAGLKEKINAGIHVRVIECEDCEDDYLEIKLITDGTVRTYTFDRFLYNCIVVGTNNQVYIDRTISMFKKDVLKHYFY